MDAKCTCIDGKQTGQRILGYMQKQGLSVNGLARMLEVTPNAVRNYIRGHNRPSVEKMYQICKIFSVDIRDIIVERKLELIVSRDCRTILLNPAGPQAHEFTKAGTTRNQALADMLAKMRLSFPVTYTVRWDEGCEMWRGDINISPKK